jgi:hypothetical protein
MQKNVYFSMKFNLLSSSILWVTSPKMTSSTATSPTDDLTDKKFSQNKLLINF